MARYKRYDYKQSLMIPVSLEDQLMPGTLEFAIHTLVKAAWICRFLMATIKTMLWAEAPMILRFS